MSKDLNFLGTARTASLAEIGFDSVPSFEEYCLFPNYWTQKKIHFAAKHLKGNITDEPP